MESVYRSLTLVPRGILLKWILIHSLVNLVITVINIVTIIYLSDNYSKIKTIKGSLDDIYSGLSKQRL